MRGASGGQVSREQRTGLIVLAVGALLLAVAFTDQIPFVSGAGGRTVVARFAEASQVDTATPVRVRGVEVGAVSALRPAPGSTTSVVMRLSTAVRLHSDASAQIRWRTLLGGSMYIDLNPGVSSLPLSGPIPLARTRTQVDWDQFNEMMPTATRPHFQQLLAGLRAGLSSGTVEGETFHVFGPYAEVIGQGAQASRGSAIGDLPTLVQSSSRVVSSLSSDRAALENLVRGADGTLAATAAHNRSLAAMIRLSPPALDSTRVTSQTVSGLLDELDPLVTRLEPGARELGSATAVMRPMLERTNRVLAAGVPLLHAARPALQNLGRAGTQGTPVLRALGPLLQRLNTNLLPWLAATDADTKLKLYETIGPLFSALSGSLASFDPNGYTYNFNVQFGPGSIELPCDTGPGGTQVTNLVACNAVKTALADVLSGGTGHR